MKAIALASLIATTLILAGCGGGNQEQKPLYKERPPKQQVLATPSQVASLLRSKDIGLLNGAPDVYTFSCTGEDNEGRRFACIKSFNSNGVAVTLATYDVVCDGYSCQWDEYDQ